MSAGTEDFFDARAARLRTSELAFEALLAEHPAKLRPIRPGWHAQCVAGLARLGALGEDGPHPALRDGLGAILAGACTVELRISSPRSSVLHRVWLLGHTAAWVRQGDPIEFLCQRNDLVPHRLADLLTLGPRAAPVTGLADSTTVRVARRVIDALLAGAPENRNAAAAMIVQRCGPRLQRWCADLVAGRWQAWHAEMTWRVGDHGWSGRAVICLDTPTGFLVATPLDGRQVELRPVRPEELWRRLLRMMPPPDDLEAAAAGWLERTRQ